MEKEITIWQPIQFGNKWSQVDTSRLDDLAPSWLSQRGQLRVGSAEYADFLQRLKRRHSIETGVIERLYDLKEGITETFIKEGFVESQKYLTRDDTNIPPEKLMDYLKDHFEAIEFVFDVVKQDRQITKGFICELHQLITRHQDTTDAIDTFGNPVKMELLKGQFKKWDNNPKRNGTKYLYCPPVQVDTEIDKLIVIFNDLEKRKEKPVIISAWFHHAFTQIHPFQDGNGRVARLLASLIFIKHGFFPFTVKRNERKEYIDSLESADRGEPQELVTFFCNAQKRCIEEALNLVPVSNKPLDEVVDVFKQRFQDWKKNQQEDRRKIFDEKRLQIFKSCQTILSEIQNDLDKKIPREMAQISVSEEAFPDSNNYFWYTHQIVEYAKAHNYFFNKTLPRGWFRIFFNLSEDRKYQLIIPIHHYGYDDATIAIGALLEFIGSGMNQVSGNPELSRRGREDGTVIINLPLDVNPHIMSLEADTAALKMNLKPFLQDIISVALAQITSEIE